MFKKLLSFFIPPKLSNKEVYLTPYSGYGSDKAYEENAQKLAVHDIELQREALQKNLVLMHRTMLISLLAVIVAIILGIVAVRAKPTVNVKVQAPTSSSRN